MDDMIVTVDPSGALLCIFVAILLYNAQREQHYLTRSAVVRPGSSPWSHLWHHGDEKSFLNLTGMSRTAFIKLKGIIFPEIDRPRMGRRPLLDENGQLGLLLFYMGSTMRTKHLCLIFGVVPSTANVVINRLILVVISRLKRHESAKIKWPSEEEKVKWAQLVNNREPSVNLVIGFVDGLAIHVQCSANENDQSEAYNGHSKDTMTNNVLAFSPEGKIFYAALSYPGSWHDSQVAAHLASKAISSLGEYQICVDQGFPRSGDLYGKFVGPLSNSTKRKLAALNKDYIIAEHEIFVSLRQASEWGMRALQGTFSRLKSRLTSDKVKRRNIILCIVLLHNYRTHEVGFNQIATVFNLEYEQLLLTLTTTIESPDTSKFSCHE